MAAAAAAAVRQAKEEARGTGKEAGPADTSGQTTANHAGHAHTRAQVDIDPADATPSLPTPPSRDQRNTQADGGSAGRGADDADESFHGFGPDLDSTVIPAADEPDRDERDSQEMMAPASDLSAPSNQSQAVQGAAVRAEKEEEEEEGVPAGFPATTPETPASPHTRRSGSGHLRTHSDTAIGLTGRAQATSLNTPAQLHLLGYRQVARGRGNMGYGQWA